MASFFGASLYTDRVNSINGEFLVPFFMPTVHHKLAVDHRRVFLILLYTDRVITPLITGEFLVPYYTDRQRYLAVRHWSPARFPFYIRLFIYYYMLYRQSRTSPLITGEQAVLYRLSYLSVDDVDEQRAFRSILGCLFIITYCKFGVIFLFPYIATITYYVFVCSPEF